MPLKESKGELHDLLPTNTEEASDILLIMFSGNLIQSVIVLEKKNSFLYSILQDGI
jgi:hypothetical protein